VCGIAGYLGNDEAAHERLPEALGLIDHRGPDSRGVERRGAVSLAMTRLAILDLPGGYQPMSSPDGHLCVVFNGEIYNYRELRDGLIAQGHTFSSKSDTEVLLHLYEAYGDDMCRHLRGMFAFAIHDRTTGRVFLGRDRFGKKPFYVRQFDGQLWFGSELKVVVGASRASRALKVSDQSVYDFLTFGSIPQPATIYTDVTMIPAGSHATLVPGGELEVTTYWEPVIEPREMGLEEATAEVRRIMAEAVRLRLRSDVPLGVFLSAGLDSTIIAYEAAREVGSTLRTFTVATGDPALDEADVATRTAAAFGIQHEVLPLSVDVEGSIHSVVAHYDQPFADSSAIPSMQINKLASEHVKVILNGDGGDELFGGYRRHMAAGQLDRLGRARRLAAPVARLTGSWQPPRRSKAGLALRLARGLAAEPRTRYLVYTHDLLREEDRARVWRGAGDVSPSERHLTAVDRSSILSTQMLDDIRLNLVSDLLVKMDMACMAHSVEGRSPFMDSELADFAFRLPDNFKVRGGTGKWLLRHAYADDLPQEVLTGAKKGFEVPLQRWLGAELRPLIADAVLAPDARVNAYLDPVEVRRIFAGEAFADRNLMTIQYSILVLELWLRQADLGVE
jgi:asparagine synthase (glutamine-hydrolysing)